MPIPSDHPAGAFWALTGDLLAVLDADERIVAANPAWASVLGWAENDLHGTALAELVHPEDLAHVREDEVIVRLRHRKGEHRPFVWRRNGAAVAAREGRRVGEQERALRDAHRVAKIASWEWDVVRDELRTSDAFSEVAGTRPVRPLRIADALDRMPPEARANAELSLERLANGSDEERGDYAIVGAHGEMVHLTARIAAERDADGRLVKVSGVTQDITEAVRATEQIREHAENLREARDYLSAVTNSMTEGVCTVDLEGRLVFMNAAAEGLLGWKRGELLGKVLTEVVGVPGDEDCFERRDGTRFVMDCTAAPLATTAGVTGTVLVFSDATERREAEARMQRELETLGWLRRVRDALDQDRFVLHAQPIIDLATGDVVQHELLIRMVGEDGTLIAPGQFLPAAEEHGLIREIDRWVVRQAARLAAQGHAVELNVSAKSVGDSELAVVVARELEEAGADPALLVFEITETALISDEAAARRFIEEVHALGCRLALDDFGTGYGGFTYLKRLAVEYLKIDIEFVRDLLHDPASQHVVRAVVSLAQGFGQRTVAEGVEDPDTLAELRRMGVDFAQGFGIGRPAAVEQVLAAGPFGQDASPWP